MSRKEYWRFVAGCRESKSSSSVLQLLFFAASKIYGPWWDFRRLMFGRICALAFSLWRLELLANCESCFHRLHLNSVNLRMSPGIGQSITLLLPVPEVSLCTIGSFDSWCHRCISMKVKKGYHYTASYILSHDSGFAITNNHNRSASMSPPYIFRILHRYIVIRSSLKSSSNANQSSLQFLNTNSLT